MLNGRVYRAGFAPLLLALALAGFALTGRAAPLASPLVPDAFNGARAFEALQRLATRFPDRRPGSAGDQALAAEVARTLRGLGSAGRGGFAVSAHSFRAQTIDGVRTLTTVLAQRPGTTGEAPIVLLAHRDAAGAGGAGRLPSIAELSGTAALLELARVLAAEETQHTIVLVSTSGGSGGDAGAADFAAHVSKLIGAGAGEGASAGGAGSVSGAGAPVDAAVVLGDLAGTGLRAPVVASFAYGAGAAPAQLQSTLATALAAQAGVSEAHLPAHPPDANGSLGSGFFAHLAHLAFPLTAGEQGPLDAAGLPAVLLSAHGELSPPAGEPVSAARLEGFGRAALAAVYALDAAPTVGAVGASGLPIRHKAIPTWALRWVLAALLAPALLALCDGLARLRRRREPVGPWVLWTLACALPFFGCALFAIAVGALGLVAAPRPPVLAAALPGGAAAVEGVLATALVLVLAWLAWPAFVRRVGLPALPAAAGPRSSWRRAGLEMGSSRPPAPAGGVPDGAVLAPPLVLGALAAVVWVFDPFASLLLVPALHLWLLLASPPPPAPGRARVRSLSLLALGLAPLALLVAFYAAHLELGLGGVAHETLLLLAGGRVGILGAALWSVAFGCAAAVLLLALSPAPGRAGAESPAGGADGYEARKIWGGGAEFKSYAGPGSLGGTEPALRR